MDAGSARRRFAEARVARLATLTAELRPHVVPCCFALEGDTVYSAVDAKPKATRALKRLENIAANPAVSMLVDHYDEDWTALWWVRADGTGRVLDAGAEHDRALGRLGDKYPQYRSAPPPGPVVAVDVGRWRAWP